MIIFQRKLIEFKLKQIKNNPSLALSIVDRFEKMPDHIYRNMRVSK
jgi:hypothetical protein